VEQRGHGKSSGIYFFYAKETYQLGTGYFFFIYLFFFFVHHRLVSAVKKVESVSDRMSYIVLRDRRCNISPDGKTHNQLDHILIDRRWDSSTLDV
jgi:hypothetical protein